MTLQKQILRPTNSPPALAHHLVVVTAALSSVCAATADLRVSLERPTIGWLVLEEFRVHVETCRYLAVE